MDLIKDPTRYQNTIFVFDRGYFSEELFESIQNKGLFFICRMRKNSLLINHDKNDAKVELKNGFSKNSLSF
jgi:transposase